MIKQRSKAVMLFIIAIIIGYFVYVSSLPGSKRPFILGLDLSGGSHLVFNADVSKLDPADVKASMTALRDDVEKRVNVFGVSEPLVYTEEGKSLSSKESAYKLIVELPGVTDPDKAASAIGATPKLEFRVITDADMKENSTRMQTLDSTSTEQEKFISLFKETGLNGTMIGRASLIFDPTTNAPSVGLSFNQDGKKLFSSITKAHKGDYLGIFLDDRLIQAPVVREEIPNGQAVISGGFTLEEAQTLVRNLNFGALPVPIKLISTQTIGPSLGSEAVKGGINAGIISFIIISVFLLIWYRLPGLVAVIALGCYTVIMLAIFLLAKVTLTAAGIAGFIITIGMAVDANILIFERMKEELASGRSVSDAMHEGFARAWLSIRDSNISSIITGTILYYFGSTSIVTGFALVFVIGVFVSMFTAISASRLFLYAIAPSRTTRLSTFLISNGFTRLK